MGETLDDLVRRGGPMSPGRAARMALAVADALADIHAAGGTHGGVTPRAVAVLEEGGTRLALSGVQDAALGFQSPSRLCEGGLSAQDDAWALLGCLYFAVTGNAPFEAETAPVLVRRVLGGRPLPIRATTPAERDIQRMFDRGFSRNADTRYGDADALRADLLRWLAAHGEPSDYPPPAEPARATEPPLAPAEPTSAAPRPDEPAPAVAAAGEVASVSASPAPGPSPRERSADHDHAASQLGGGAPAPRAKEAPSGGRRVLAAFVAGGLAAAAATALLFPRGTARDRPARPPSASEAATAIPAKHDAAPPASAVAPPPRASAAPSGVAAADLDACVGAWFPPGSLDADTDLAFLCAESDGRRGTAKLRGAIVAGGRGRKVTDAMVEWTRLGWFELPVYATLRARCCLGAPPIELPQVLGSTCAPPGEAIHALAVVTAEGGDVTAAIRAYRKNVSCLVETGSSLAYGQRGPIDPAEEPAFRAFAGRGGGGR